jgi:transposase
MWTAKNRGRYDRSALRYPSDLTDDEWALVEPLIPPARRGGNKRHVDEREVMNGIMYILSTGCQWRAIPKDLSTCGATTGRSIAFITRFMWSAVSEANAKPAPPQPSSIAKASRALKKGALYRSAWL